MFWVGFQTGVMLTCIVFVIFSEIYKRKLYRKRQQYNELIEKGNEMYTSAQYWSLMKMDKEAKEYLDLANKYYKEADQVFQKSPKKETSDKKESKN